MASFCSSYIPTGAAAVTRAADALSFPFLAPPQAMTVYADAVDLMTPANWNYATAWQIGTTASARWNSYGFSSAHYADFNNGSATQTAGVTPTGAAFGSRIERLATLTGAGVGQLTDVVNSGTADVGVAATAQALPSSWGAATLCVGANNLGTNPAFLALRSLKVAAGVRDMFWMRNRPA